MFFFFLYFLNPKNAFWYRLLDQKIFKMSELVQSTFLQNFSSHVFSNFWRLKKKLQKKHIFTVFEINKFNYSSFVKAFIDCKKQLLFFLSVADSIKCYDHEGISIGNIEQYINRGNIEAMKHYGLWMILQKLSDEHMLKFRTTMLIGNGFCCCCFSSQ